MLLKMKDSDIKQCVQVKVEIGHRATPRLQPTKEGFTHDWTVYVRAKNGCNLGHIVTKMEFHLHDPVADPVIVVNQPPYHVSGVGYADFRLPIEIYFRNMGEPHKINYNHFLKAHEQDNYDRCEILLFVNPPYEFKRRLIEAGGATVSKQILKFYSSSGINTSLISTAKDVKIDDKSKGHDAASILLSSSSNSISKDNVQKSQSSKEKHSSKESHNTSEMVPNLYPLPPRKSPSESPIPSENNQPKIRQCSSASIEMSMNEDKQGSEGKSIKDQVVKHNSSQNKVISQSKSKDGKDQTDTRKQTSSESSKVLKKKSKLKDDTVSKFDDKKQAKDNKEENNGISSVSGNDCFREITGSDSGVDCGIIKIVSQNYSINSLTKLMDKLSLNSADDDDEIMNTVDVFSGPISSDKYSPMVVSVKEGECSEDISSKSDDDFFLESSESDMDIALNLTSNISNTSNHRYSMSDLNISMDELDSSEDDEDNKKSQTTTNEEKSKQRKRSGFPISTLFGSRAKRQRVV